MKVSVLMITYNQETYIAQALTTVLMQIVDFDYEIVVGEDCSTDNTRKVILEYMEKYPGKIRLLPPEDNLGMMRNLIKTYSACAGEYIAVLEGDDLWTDPHKLQRQVTFLDAHPDFAICFHNADYLWETDGEPPTKFLCSEDQKEVSDLEDLLNGNFIPTLTSMFRNRLFGSFPGWFDDLKYGDWPLHILNAQFGKIGYLKESMASYRVHPGGVASIAHTNKKKYVETLMNTINFYVVMDTHFNYRYKQIIDKKLSENYCLVAKGYESLGEPLNASRYYIKHISTSSVSEVLRRIVARLGRMARNCQS